MIKEKVRQFLQDREFISVGTADAAGRPNAAPKFVLKTGPEYIYLVDYAISRTWNNIKNKPWVSLSFMDQESLIGYQVNGSVEIIDRGEEYNKMTAEFEQRELTFSTKRIIDGVAKGKKHQNFEVAIPKKFVIFKVKMEEITEIGPGGNLEREYPKDS